MARKLNPSIHTIFDNQLPDHLDLLIPEDPRDQTEGEFIGAMVKEVNERLKPAGLGCFFMGPNITNHGYRLGFLDAERRRYYCGFTYDEAIAMGETSPGTPFQALLTLVCERALVARQVEFEKAKASVPSLSLAEVVQENVPS